MRLRTMAGGLVTTGLLGAGMLGLTGAAYADGGCPDGGDWQLLPVSAVIDQVDNGNFKDQNGDGLGCFKINKGQTEKYGGFPSFTWKDNTNPV